MNVTIPWRATLIGLGATVLLCAGPSGVTAADQPPDAGTTLTVAVHVHSTISTGGLSLDQIAEQARRMGINAVVLSENLALRYEYGLFPLRGILRRTVTLPSVTDYGLDRYLAEVAQAQTRHPNVLLVPGVEVAPHYYWTGSLLDKNLTMHNSQKNLLVVGLRRPEDYAALPVPGTAAFSRYGWETLGRVWPVLLFVPAVRLWRLQVRRRVGAGEMPAGVITRFRVPAGLMAASAAVLLALAWPYDVPIYSFYDDQVRERPYQAVIDAAGQRGGIAVWSMPEAVDFNVHPFGLLGPVTVKTDPYPASLLQTDGYAGFGGVYQDTRTITEPGALWDQLLLQCLDGQRAAPPFSFGEIAFHRTGQAGIELNQVLNVVTVRERTVAGLMEAMRAGRFYALAQAGRKFGLRLDTFQVETQDGSRAAGAGESFAGGRQLPAVRVAVSATDGGSHQVLVRIVRSGQVIARLDGTTPFHQRIVDATVPAGAAAYYRVDVRGEGEILSNPIFVKPEPVEK
jgi:hypothetical protein